MINKQLKFLAFSLLPNYNMETKKVRTNLFSYQGGNFMSKGKKRTLIAIAILLLMALTVTICYFIFTKKAEPTSSHHRQKNKQWHYKFLFRELYLTLQIRYMFQVLNIWKHRLLHSYHHVGGSGQMEMVGTIEPTILSVTMPSFVPFNISNSLSTQNKVISPRINVKNSVVFYIYIL